MSLIKKWYRWLSLEFSALDPCTLKLSKYFFFIIGKITKSGVGYRVGHRVGHMGGPWPRHGLAQVLYKSILKWERLKLIFRGWNRPVCNLFGITSRECLSVKLHFTLRQWSELRRHSDAEFPFLLFFSLSASFKHSSPWEKVGKLSPFCH